MTANPVRLYVDSMLGCPTLGTQIVLHRCLPATAPEYGVNIRPWHAAIECLLKERKINLFSHQALATDHIRSGHSVVIATPTASGKSLVYNLPVLEQHLRDPEARSLYIFPLKALAQDQLAAFRSLCSSWPGECRPEIAIYDGDTGEAERRRIRSQPPAVLITTPEMLHRGILPYHENWNVFLANLRYVVVDEAHTYRGLFGCHMAQVFRRLNRIAGRYGAMPAYVFCTATLGNPAELAGRLMGRQECGEPVLIEKSGAPQGLRHFIFINPHLAASTCAINLLKRALECGLRTIVYCQSRRMTELVSLWAGSEAGAWKDRISSYRAGYLPQERREIEARMASGELMAIISTSALELGIDIGGLDVCILVGYPGTISQTLQRGGRVGRAGQESAVILVAGDDAMDQYFARNPEDFFARPPERATVNPDNETILQRHLECAATEFPLLREEAWLKQPAAARAVNRLEQAGLLLKSADGGKWIASRNCPQRNIDLRGSGNSYVLEDQAGRIAGTIDGFRIWREAHPGAVYLHRGRTYLIREIDEGQKRVLMEPAQVDWHTRARGRKETEILEVADGMVVGNCAVFRGRLRITEQTTGYEKRHNASNQIISVTPLDAPLQMFETDGMWFVIPDQIRLGLESLFFHFMGSIHALEHAVIALLPLEVMADRNDFGGISIPLHPQLGQPAVFIYDAMPGGAGLVSAAYERAASILASTRKAIASCECEDGCPSCIQSPKCGAGNRPLSKAGVLELLARMLAPEDDGQKIAGELTVHPLTIQEKSMEAASLASASSPCSAISPVVFHPCPGTPPEHYVVFDIETRLSAAEVGGWNNAAKMGVSIAVLYDSKADACFTYQQAEMEAMFERMAAASLVVGFNSLRFDYKVLAPFAALSGSFDLESLPSLDLLQNIYERLNYRISLDNLCKATLNSGKCADGLQALRWWKEGRLDEIAAYCRKDVELTRDLYLFGLKEQYLLFTNKAGMKTRVPVDFTRAC